MSVLDRAIIKAFERRSHSAPAEKPPVVDVSSSATQAPSQLPSAIVPENKSVEASIYSASLRSNDEIGRAVETVDQKVQVTQSGPVMSSDLLEHRESLPSPVIVERNGPNLADEFVAKPDIADETASREESSRQLEADLGRAALLNSHKFGRTDEHTDEHSVPVSIQTPDRTYPGPPPIPESISILKANPPVGGQTQLPAPASSKPTPQSWKWPEICEQLDQFTGEGFQQLAGHLQSAAEQGHKVLAFVSSQPNAGRTSVLMTLTRILALEGKSSVLLIDADHRHPNIASLTNLHPATELKAVLQGSSRTVQATIPMTPGRVSVLPMLEPIADGEWRKLATTFRVILHQARRDYDMILIDAGVFGAESKLTECWLRGIADAVVTVSRQLPAPGAEHVVLDWKQIGIESLGVIETFA
jgi:Mrp family chromosome partitioning ATPase